MKFWNWKKKNEESVATGTYEPPAYEPPTRDFIIKCTPLHKDYVAFEFPVRFVMPARNYNDFQVQVSNAVDQWFREGGIPVGTRVKKISSSALKNYVLKIETERGE